jgi:sugar-specific transcriptional regulator TrmB
MLSLDKHADTLSHFGLTHNKAKAYLAMVQLGIASIREVSNTSEIRREEIYRMLPDLEKLGLIEKVLGKPLKIKATPVDTALFLLIEREKQLTEDKLSSLIDKKETFLSDFKVYNLQSERKDSKANFSLIMPREAVISKGASMLDAAKRSMDIVTSFDGVRMLQNMISNFDEVAMNAVRKGVKMRIVVSTSEQRELVLRIQGEYQKLMEIRYCNQSLNHYTIVDYEEALISTSTEPLIGNTPYLWTNNRNLIEILKVDFERVWSVSFPKEDLTDEKTLIISNVINSLKPMNHALFLYSNQEEKHNVLFSFIKIGLESDDVSVYLTTEESADQIREAMRRHNIDVESYENMEALHIIESSYDPSEGFDVTSTIAYLKKFYDEAITNGFKGCRICGEMEYFFKNNLREKMLEYEKTLNRLFTIPIIGICAFNKNTINSFTDPTSLYSELVMAHSNILTMQGNNLRKIDIHSV